MPATTTLRLRLPLTARNPTTTLSLLFDQCQNLHAIALDGSPADSKLAVHLSRWSADSGKDASGKTKTKTPLDIKRLFVLTNRETASASETLSMILKLHANATIVGKHATTFGKGLVGLENLSLPNKGSMRMFVAKNIFIAPDGTHHDIHDKGVKSDLVNGNPLRAVLEMVSGRQDNNGTIRHDIPSNEFRTTRFDFVGEHQSPRNAWRRERIGGFASPHRSAKRTAIKKSRPTR